MPTKSAGRVKSPAPGRRPRAPRSGSTGIVGRVRQDFGLTRREFSRLTGYSERAIVNWEGGRTPDEPALRRVKEMDRLRARLARVIKPEYLGTWLSAPNEAFDGLKPVEVIERGEIDRLWDMIFYLESGIAS